MNNDIKMIKKSTRVNKENKLTFVTGQIILYFLVFGGLWVFAVVMTLV